MDRTLLKNIFDVVCDHFKERACNGCPLLSLSIETNRVACRGMTVVYPAETEKRIALWLATQAGLLNKPKSQKDAALGGEISKKGGGVSRQDFEYLIGRMCHYYGERCNGCPLDYLKNTGDRRRKKRKQVVLTKQYNDQKRKP